MKTIDQWAHSVSLLRHNLSGLRCAPGIEFMIPGAAASCPQATSLSNLPDLAIRSTGQASTTLPHGPGRIK